MNNFNDLKKNLKNLDGELLIIGELDEKIFKVLDNNTNLKSTYYLNCNDNSHEDIDSSNLSDVANSLDLKELHKYFKDGIDNIFCNFTEIKNFIPSFVRESLKITKKNIYITFNKKEEYDLLEKKYKRYGLKVNYYFFEDYCLGIVEANDIIVHWPKETYYYVKDSLEKIYIDISDNI